MKRLRQGIFLITQDSFGVSEKLSDLFRVRNCTVSIIAREVLENEDALNQWCLSLVTGIETIAGIVHLTQIGSDWLQTDAPVQAWRKQLFLNEKSLFLLLHNLYRKLTNDAHILAASGLGGYFCRNGNDRISGLSLQGGMVGLLKSLHEERPGLRVKAVDVDPGQPADAIALCLMDELELAGGRLEVGYPGGQRTIFQTVPSFHEQEDVCLDLIRNVVVLATGGTRGVTAELLRELAAPGNTLLLTGRSPLPEDEPEHLQRLTTPLALRQHFISEVRDGSLQMTPVEIQRKVQSIIAAREMRYNINDFKQRGADVQYYPADVTNEEAMCRLFNTIYKQYSEISGVVHGAGIIEDKLLVDKMSDSWSRVVETKVIGLLLLQKYLRPESLRFLAVLSSVAGRYGNSGQTDYATANELMNRLCCQISRIWGNRVNVKALCWGPWGTTESGAGMVTEDTEAKFARKGVTLVNAEAGRRLFKDELTHNGVANVEIVCGEGPWERHEAAIGRIERDSKAVTDDVLYPLIGTANVSALPNGDKVIPLCLDETHAYLQEHCIDNVPVMPAAVALEIMSEAACFLCSGWHVVEAHDFRLFKGIVLKEQNCHLQVVISQPVYDGDKGFEVNAAIQSGQDDRMQRVHYRTVLRFDRKFPEGFKYKPQSHTEKKLNAAEVYAGWLFHGPRFQVIEEIEGMSRGGVRALLRTTFPSQWMLNVGIGCNQWLFDPALVDAAAQMALVWDRAYHNESALPTRFCRVIRYSEILPKRVYMNFELIASESPQLVRANVCFSDADNNVVLSIEGLESVSSVELNRLGGTANGFAKVSVS